MLVTQRDREIRRKMRVLDYAASVGSASQTCRYFGVGRAAFYRWKDVLAKEGAAGPSGLGRDLLFALSGPDFEARRQQRSSTIEAPCPTPTHIVQRA
jgi:hypothetical protein